MKKLFLTITLLSVLTTSCAQKPEQPQQAQQPQYAPQQVRYADFSDVASQTIDGVVHIRTVQTRLTPLYQSFFGFIINQGMQRQEYAAYGSGVIISDDGYIVTNNHVVQDAERISVTLNDKRVVSASLVGNDPATDLAVIKIDASDLHPIAFGNSDSARVGQPVLAIGNPFNLTSTVTAGIISAKARNMGIIENTRGKESTIEAFIQTDAAVNPGNSGGALVDASAKLIGIVTAIASADGYYTGYSFAIPSNLVKKVSDDLRRYGYVQRAYLGVNVLEMTSEMAQRMSLSEVKGVLIARVVPGSAADKAGLRNGDLLLSVAGVAVNSYAQMMEELGRFNPGDHVDITYYRDGRTHSVTVTLQNSKGTTELHIRN
ncbi:MAG: trypsin-like peptidase domain-containing protein [Bacteroidales bacterium]|nr:trypsin-like peptidase domain-containing protein [Bacteroidales bacterium]